MRVLKWGVPFKHTTYKSRCLECYTVVQFCEGEAGFAGTSKDGYFLEVKCPNCAGQIYYCVRIKKAPSQGKPE